MDASKLIERRRLAAIQYLSRGQVQDAGMVTYRNAKIAAAGGFVAPYSQSNYLNANCCPPTATTNHGAASDYGDSRLDTASQAGGVVNSAFYVQDRRAGAAICCANVPATTPPAGITYPCCEEMSTINPGSRICNGGGYNQTPHFVSPNCCPPTVLYPSTLFSLPVQPC
jgi:hypothetical protein